MFVLATRVSMSMSEFGSQAAERGGVRCKRGYGNPPLMVRLRHRRSLRCATTRKRYEQRPLVSTSCQLCLSNRRRL